MSNDLANQKFVLECVDEDLLISGDKMKLRALTNGQLLGLVKADPLTYELRVQTTWENEAATLFSPLLVHEEIYRSASRFSQFVHMMGSDLEVVELRVPKRRGQSLKEWDASGWRIFAINGKAPTREEVDEILQKGKGSKMVKAQSSVSDPADNNMDLWKSVRPGAEAAARGEYIVQFVRPGDGHKMLTHFFNKKAKQSNIFFPPFLKRCSWLLSRGF